MTTRHYPLRATARLQFHREFTLDDAIAVVPYLAALGISHLYASPLLKARAGSVHGYDVIDHGEVNPELGGAAAFERLSETLAAYDLGLIVDFVPNHMAIGVENAWWMDVLAHGRRSAHANFFDIDWESHTSPGKLFLPVLSQPYPDALLAGDVGLTLRGARTRLVVDCGGQIFPASLQSVALLLDRAALVADQPTAQVLEGLAGRFDAIADERDDVALLDAFSDLFAKHHAARSAIEEVVGTLAAGHVRPPEAAIRLDAYLQLQHYRLAYWRVAPSDINYRRFFDINDLAAIRVEDPAVFSATHRWILEQIRDGRLHGLRLDHIDGLLDPTGYLRRLRAAVSEAGAPPDFPILVEKILAPYEDLPEAWSVQGTTGYESMDAIQSILIDRRGRHPMEAAYRAFTGETRDMERAIWEARREILRDSFAGTALSLIQVLGALSRRDWRYRDIAEESIRAALVALVQAFTVYRTYVGPDGKGPRYGLAAAVRAARRTIDRQHLRALDFLEGTFGGAFEPVPGETPSPGDETLVRAARLATLRFQQITSPVAAKAVEDTAFYRMFPLASLNEVGGMPERFGMTHADFDDFAARQQERYPGGLVTLATHDHKRGADVRARLSVLSEASGEWGPLLQRLAAAAAAWRGQEAERDAPSRAHEYLLYQTLLGVLPLVGEDATLPDRLCGYMLKAAREGKEETSWVEPDMAYEAALESFTRSVASAAPDGRFRQELDAMAKPLLRGGAIKSLAQVAIQLTMPGVPDLYQGTDRFDFSLVDPDNRRPVDWQARADALDAFERTATDDLLSDWQDGQVKQWLIWRLLQARKANPDLFAKGRYVPLDVSGPRTEEGEAHLLAFGRVHNGHRLCTIVPRFVLDKMAADGGLGLRGLEGTRLEIPHANRAIDILTGQLIEDGVVEIAPLLARLPVAVIMMPPR